MKQSHIAWKLLLVGGLATPFGCTADGADTIQIIRNQLPAEGCIVSTVATGTYQPRGRIDVSSVNGYRFTPLVQSLAEANDASMRRTFVSGANIDITFPGANAPTVSAGLENSLNFRSLFSGSIAASAAASFDFDIITRELLADLVDDVTPTNPVQVVASVTIVGDLDGDSVESNTFDYPIEICDGCLRNDLGPCLGLPEDTVISTGGVCNTLQDGVVDCCTAEDGSLTCPAVPIIPPDPA